jgi:hypothetical protein
MAVDPLGPLRVWPVPAAHAQERAHVGPWTAQGPAGTGDAVEVACVDDGDTGDQAAPVAAAHGLQLAGVKRPAAKRDHRVPHRAEPPPRQAPVSPSPPGIPGGFDPPVSRLDQPWCASRFSTPNRHRWPQLSARTRFTPQRLGGRRGVAARKAVLEHPVISNKIYF